MAGANKRGIHLAELKKAKLQKQTEVETTKSSKKYERKAFQEISPEIFEEKTRSGTQKPRERDQYTSQDFAMMFDSIPLKSTVKIMSE